MYGLTKYGFVVKRGDIILQGLHDGLKAAFPQINLSVKTVNSVLSTLVAEEAADLWTLAAGVYYAFYPQTAEGQSLDNTCEINAITRLGQTASKAVLSVKGTEGTEIPDTFIAQKENTAIQFQATESIIITKDLTNKLILEITDDPPPADTDYIIVINDHTVIVNSQSLSKIELAEAISNEINSLTDLLQVSSELPSPQDGSFTILSNDLDTPFVAAPDSKFTINDFWCPIHSKCTQVGAIAALSGTINEIVTPVFGLDSVTNFLDAEEGREIEIDTALRQRRYENVRVVGAATVEAIRARILNEVDGVLQCKVYENDEDEPDTEGRPPHSDEALVLGGDDQEIAEKYWLVKAGGIKTFGSTSVLIYDSMDNPHTISFSRPVPVYIWLRLTLVTDSSFPPNGQQQITNGILETGVQSFGIGDDVLIQKFYCPIYQVPGVVSALVEIAATYDLTPPTAYVTTNIPIDQREASALDSSRITYV
jgi:uncharacterized phage protein gp47/JayE